MVDSKMLTTLDRLTTDFDFCLVEGSVANVIIVFIRFIVTSQLNIALMPLSLEIRWNKLKNLLFFTYLFIALEDLSG